MNNDAITFPKHLQDLFNILARAINPAMCKVFYFNLGAWKVVWGYHVAGASIKSILGAVHEGWLWNVDKTVADR